jgi:hypothetical protein
MSASDESYAFIFHVSGISLSSHRKLESFLKSITLRIPSVAEDLNSLTPQQFEALFGDPECHVSGVNALPDVIDAIAAHGQFSRPKDQLPSDVDYHNRPPFEYAEHFKIADALALPGWKSPATNSSEQSSRYQPFKLKNGLVITYGQINGLAGDFFGTKDPISEGGNFKEQKELFLEAFKTLNQDNVAKPQAILKILQDEVDKVNKKIQDGGSVKDLYGELGSRLSKLQDASLACTTITKADGQDYESLLKVNVDHFAPNNRTAYNAGHAAALETAKAGDLGTAYAMNAFADHFLEDAFASGHCRVPRGAMMRTNMFANACSNVSNLPSLLGFIRARLTTDLLVHA